MVGTLEARTETPHEVTVLDPLELRLPVLESPQFYYPPGEAPPELEAASAKIEAADAFVIVSPVNH